MKVYTYNSKVLTNSANGKWLKEVDAPPVDPFNPLGLPALTIRVKLASGSSAPSISNTTVTAVQGQADVYDICTANTSRLYNWNSLLSNRSTITEVLGANSAGVTNMSNMFYDCAYLTSVPLFDTSHVSNMESMFEFAQSLTVIPLFATSSVTNVNHMFYYCQSVESGALALYQQLSTQTNPPVQHSDTFEDCGSNTQTGAAELAQIPYGWK